MVARICTCRKCGMETNHFEDGYCESCYWKMNLPLASFDSISIRQPKAMRSLSFSGENNTEIGRLYWDNELKFEGNAEESAKVFIKWLKELWDL